MCEWRLQDSVIIESRADEIQLRHSNVQMTTSPSIRRENLKSTGVQRRNGGGKVVGVVPTKFHPNWMKIAKVCFWGGCRVLGVG